MGLARSATRVEVQADALEYSLYSCDASSPDFAGERFGKIASIRERLRRPGRRRRLGKPAKISQRECMTRSRNVELSNCVAYPSNRQAMLIAVSAFYFHRCRRSALGLPGAGPGLKRVGQVWMMVIFASGRDPKRRLSIQGYDPRRFWMAMYRSDHVVNGIDWRSV